MIRIRLNGTGGTALAGLAAAALALSACSTSDSGDGIETANTTTTVEAEASESDPSEGPTDGAETGDAAAGTEGGVIQTEAGDTETADTAKDGQTNDGAASDDDAAPDNGEPAEDPTDTDSGAGDGDGTGDDGSTASETPPPTQPEEPEAPADEEPAPIDEDPEDDPAAEDRFELDTPDGSLVDLTSGSETDLSAELTGTYTLLWFWTPSTPSSGQEAPLVERFAETFAGAIDVVAIGSGGERSAADQFHRSSGLSVTTLWASSDESAAHYGVERVPSALLIDSAGTIIGRWEGLPEEAFRLAERIT